MLHPQDLAKTVHKLRQYCQKPPEIDPRPRLYKLANPHACLWQGQKAKISRAAPVKHSARKTLLFVHGMEYRQPTDVLRDLIRPFEQQARFTATDLRQDYDFYFVSWNSSLLTHAAPIEIKDLYRKLGKYGLPLFMLFSFRYWRRILDELEHRSRIVADYLTPLYCDMLENDDKPLVVSHSLGSHIWSQVTQRHLAENGFDSPVANWQNFQPAVPHNAYSEPGEFSLVGKRYELDDVNLKIWYSRMDMVLSSIYLLTKSCYAMGQIGSSATPQLPQIDMTWLTKEAHGVTKIGLDKRDFWARVGHQLRMQLGKSEMSLPA